MLLRVAHARARAMCGLPRPAARSTVGRLTPSLQACQERNQFSLTFMGCGVLASKVKVPMISRPFSFAVTLYSP